jgi:hypothetical protein
MSIQPRHASHLKKCSASSIGCTPTRLPMTGGIGGVMLAILALCGYRTSERRCSGYLAPGGYLNFLGRSFRKPFGGDQNASICLIGKQSEQLRLFLVGLRKR